MRRFVHPRTGRTLVVPLDHGLSLGSISGLEDLPRTIALAERHGVDAIVLHKGSLQRLLRSPAAGPLGRRLAIVVHLTGATVLSPLPARQVRVGGVEEALALGADAVSVQLNLGTRSEAEALRMVGRTAERAARWGLPLLVMAYVRDEAGTVCSDPRQIVHAARAAADLGADLIKIPFPGTPALAALVRAVGVPVLIAGGTRSAPGACEAMAAEALAAGAAGLCIGRNVFQSEDPKAALDRLVALVHGGGQATRQRLSARA